MLKLLNKYKVFAVILLLIFSNIVYIFYENQTKIKTISEEEQVQALMLEEEKSTDEEVLAVGVPTVVNYKVYICGAVNKPGVYTVPSTSIVNDVLNVAGGFTEEADQTVVNLAEAVKEATKIYIPKIGEEIDKTSISYENGREEKKCININAADSQVLETLPGIGPARASQIIAYREEVGFFKEKEELKNVPGIGDKIYESLEEFITIE